MHRLLWQGPDDSDVPMVELIPTALAVLAVALFATALLAMTVRNFQVAGFSFLSASLVIYIRETRYGPRANA